MDIKKIKNNGVLKMKKIAIITIYDNDNYGNRLQNYAVQEILKESKLGEPITIKNYSITNIKDSNFIKNFLRVLKGKYLLFKEYKKCNKQRLKAFKEFGKYINTTSKTFNFCMKEKEYDVYIVGSDQTWNPDCVEEKFFKIFLLSFVHEPEKKCAYAPSIGRNHVDDHCLEMYKQYLSEFNYISCRETSGCQILTKALDRNVLQVIDPTLLLNAKDWSEIARNPINENGYILCYILGSKTCICEFAKKLAKKENKKLYIISKNYIIFQKYHKYILCGVGPSEFVGLIKNCSCMVTDSFHGTIFSINFKKDFYTFHKRPGASNVSDNSRILDTLKQFGLEGRFREDADYSFDRHIEYDKISLFLDKLRKESVSYLENVLKA